MLAWLNRSADNVCYRTYTPSCDIRMTCNNDKRAVSLRNCLTIEPYEFERWFRLWDLSSGIGEVIEPSQHNVYLAVRRRGDTAVLSKENAVKADTEGNVLFIWSTCFKNLPAGYYEADLYIDCETCFSLAVHIPPCRDMMEAGSANRAYCGGLCPRCESNPCNCCGPKTPLEVVKEVLDEDCGPHCEKMEEEDAPCGEARCEQNRL